MGDRRGEISLVLTAHGRARARQRGAPLPLLLALIQHADRAVPAGGGCLAVSASHRAIGEAEAEGVEPAIAARLGGRVMVLDEWGRVVTTFVAERARERLYTTRRTTARGRRRRR